jgi:hypothetical protein
MAIDFPNAPSPGATFTANSKTWTFTNGKWALNVSVGGVTGPAGVAIQETAPATTDILWVDTSDTGLVIVPVGGTTGQVLAKSSGTDYATTWATPVTSGDLALKANLASPTFTGTPTLPTGTIATTQTAGDSTTAVATTAFVGTAVANLVDSAPATLNTLDELAAALGDDANFATTTATAIGAKAPLVSPSFTTPALGVATATSVNGTTIPTSKTLVVTTDKLSALAATTSAELAGVISDETGTGALVFGTSPALVTPTGIVKNDVGLGSVDNTADTAKPVSTAQQTALNLKANLASPTFTGTATFPNVTIDGASGTISSQGVGNFKTIASNGRGVGISGGTGDTPAILQFTNHAVNAQWGVISASSAGEITISGRILNTSVNIATGTPFVTTVNTTSSTNIATVSLTVKGGRPVLVMASGDANPSTNDNAWNYIQLFRGETGIGRYVIQQASGPSNNQAFGIVALDPSPSAGTYTYSLRAWNGDGPLTYGETGTGQAPVIIALELL